MTNKYRLLIEHLHPEIKSPIKMGIFDTKIEAEQGAEALDNVFSFKVVEERISDEEIKKERRNLFHHEAEDGLSLLLSSNHLLSMNKVYMLKKHFGSEFKHTGIFAFFNHELLHLSPSGDTIAKDYINHYSQFIDHLVEEVPVTNEALLNYKELRDLTLLRKTLSSHYEKVTTEFNHKDNAIVSQHMDQYLKSVFNQIKKLDDEIQSTSLSILTENFTL